MRCAGVVAGVLLAGTIATPAAALDWPGRAAAVGQSVAGARGGTARADEVAAASSLDPTSASVLLRPLLRDRAAEVRAAAASAAGQARAVGLVPDLVDRLTDRDAYVRAAAVSAIGELRARTAAGQVSRAVADPDPSVRAAAVTALAALGTIDGVTAITEALEDRSREVVVAALEALGTLGHRGAAFAVVEKTRDPNAEVAIAAIHALEEIGGADSPTALTDLVADIRPGVGSAAIDALVRLGAVEAAPTLVREVFSPSWLGARSAAVAALAALRSPSAAGPLSPFLAVEPSAVADYYVAIGPASWRTFRSVGGGGVARNVRSAFVEAWLRSGDPAALPYADRVLDVDTQARLIRSSPTPEAFCRVVETAVETVPSDLAVDWVRWGVEAGAPGCVETLLDRGVTLTMEAGLDAAAETAAAAPGIAMRVLDSYVDVARVGWEDARELLAAVDPSNAESVSLILRLTSAADARVRRDAAWVLEQVGPAGLRQLDDILGGAWNDAGAELLPVVAALEEPDRVGVHLDELASGGRPELRAAAVHVAASECSLRDDTVLHVVRSANYWVRRAGFDYVRRCGAGESVAAAVEAASDPVARSVAQTGWSADALRAAAGDGSATPFARASAVAELVRRGEGVPDEMAVSLSTASSPIVVAAGWLAGAAASLTPEERVMVAAAAPSPAERAALLLAAPAVRGDALDHLARRESDPAVRRIVAGALPLEAPVEILVVDRATGAVRRDQTVLALFQDGGFELGRTGGAGRLTFDRADIVAVFVIEEAR